MTFAEGVAQIDPDTFDVESTYDIAVGYGSAVGVGETGAWVRTDGGPFLTGIDPKAHQITSVVTARDLPSGGNVVEIDGALWATAFDDAALVRLDAPPNRSDS